MDLNMKTKKPNAELVWKQVDDSLVPRLQLGPIDRAAYCYLLRHSRLEGKLQLRFSLRRLAQGTCVSAFGIKSAVRRLGDYDALRLVVLCGPHDPKSERPWLGHFEQRRAAESGRGSGLRSIADN